MLSDSGLPSTTRRADVGIVRPFIENPRAVGTHRDNGIDDGRQFLQFDVDPVGQILGLRPRRHHAGRDGLSQRTGLGDQPTADRGCGDARRVLGPPRER